MKNKISEFSQGKIEDQGKIQLLEAAEGSHFHNSPHKAEQCQPPQDPEAAPSLQAFPKPGPHQDSAFLLMENYRDPQTANNLEVGLKIIIRRKGHFFTLTQAGCRENIYGRNPRSKTAFPDVWDNQM